LLLIHPLYPQSIQISPLGLRYAFASLIHSHHNILNSNEPQKYFCTFTRGVHSLLYFAYTCVRDLCIGGVIYLAEKIIRWWYFTCKKPENIICDGIVHVNMFHYFKIPYFTCTFFTKFTYNEYIGPFFYPTLFYDFRQWSPRAPSNHTFFNSNVHLHPQTTQIMPS
jgi:hypothetical protein